MLSVAGLFLGKGILLPVVNVTSTLFAVMYAIVSFGVLRHRRAAQPLSGYRVPGGRLLVWAAAAFSLYLIVLSLLQQRVDAGGRLPTEWLLLIGLGLCGWAMWKGSAASRRAITEAERRRIMIEERA